MDNSKVEGGNTPSADAAETAATDGAKEVNETNTPEGDETNAPEANETDTPAVEDTEEKAEDSGLQGPTSAGGDDAQVDVEKNQDGAEKEVEKIDIIREYFLWIVIIVAGVVLILVAVILLAVSGGTTEIPFTVRVPSIQGSMRVFSINGEPLKFTTDLKYIGNIAARNLRRTVEPKLVEIYKGANLDVASVLVQAFKYGNAGESAAGEKADADETSKNDTSGRRKRSAATDLTAQSIIVRHWVYLKTNTTPPEADMKNAVKKSAEKVKGISVDIKSIIVLKLINMTIADTLLVLTQYGFFKEGLTGLDMDTLAQIGFTGPSNLGVQSEDDGLCPALLPPSNGAVTPSECEVSTNSYLGMLCSIKCNAGYVLSGPVKRLCLSNGQWSGSPASCSPVCPLVRATTFSLVQPRTCLSPNNSAGQLCVLQCPATHHLDTTGSSVTERTAYFRECMDTRMWAGHPGFCRAKCPRVVLFDHQQVTANSPARCMTQPLEGDICAVECASGFTLEGGGSILQLTCDVSGRWSRSVLQCRRTCSNIAISASYQKVEPAQCKTAPYDGMKCLFSCDAGYQLNGNAISMCQSDGTWDNAMPECLKVCSKLPTVDNGIIMTDKGSCLDGSPISGSECSFACIAGFAPSVSKITCTNGTWSNTEWGCLGTCKPLPAVTNGKWSPATCSSAGHPPQVACKLQCDDTFVLVGQDLKCDSASGLWNGVPGSCKKSCSALSAPAEGSLVCSNAPVEGNVCKFSCNGGFVVTGSRMVTCKADGTWSNSSPTCSAGKEYIIEQQRTGYKICLSVDQENGNEVIKVHDQNGQCSSTEHAVRWMVEAKTLKHSDSGLCLSVGVAAGVLKMAACDDTAGTQQFATSSQYQVKSASGLYVSYGLRSLLSPSGVAAVHPRDQDANWRFVDTADDVAYNLYGARNAGKCSAFVPPADMSVTGTCTNTNQAVSTSCAISCSVGSLSDPTQTPITCAKGLWSSSPDLACILDSGSAGSGCADYASALIVGATINPSSCTSGRTAIDGKCEIACSSPKYVDGPSVVTCTSDGRWYPMGTSACKTYCPVLTAADNSYFTGLDTDVCTSGKAKSDDVCSFGCKSGYRLRGQSQLTCTDTGTWSATPPTCIAVCPELPVKHKLILECNAQAASGIYDVDTKCTFSCIPNYQLVPDDSTSTVCQINMTWSISHTPSCEPACPPIVLSTDQEVSPASCLKGAKIGKECTMTCSKGYLEYQSVLTQSAKLVCGKDQMWQGPVAVCVKACPASNSSGVVANGYFTPSKCAQTLQPVGSVCQLSCDKPYSVGEGAAVAHCTIEGKWEFENNKTEFGSCLLSCEALPRTSNAIISPQSCAEGYVEPGSVCSIRCPQYMDRVGPAVRRCLGYVDAETRLRWSGGAANTYCVARCPALPVQSQTFVYPNECTHTSMIEGANCVFECERGFELTGSPTLTCTSTGAWNNPVPVCKRFCPATQILNGNLDCNNNDYLFPASGYMRAPGTKCTFTCSTGYAPIDRNEITCTEQGIWSPDPNCVRVADTFSILQKLKSDTKCVVAKQDLTANREWVMSFALSSDACLAAGNDAIWYWFDNFLLRHAGTGLCLSANARSIDSELSLSTCDVNNEYQQWNCDAAYPYRIVVKGTNLGIDSTYVEIGPLLQKWTHSKSYWITFNDELETTATLCSYKVVGICPGLDVPNVVVSPTSCKSDVVPMWQECDLQCEDGSSMIGDPMNKTTCQPTGIWKGIDGGLCSKNCPALSASDGKVYNPASCSSEGATNNGQCIVTCASGYALSNEESQWVLLCNNGVWSDQNIPCLPQCDTPASAPEHGSVKCDGKTCTFACDVGYAPNPSDAVMVAQCSVGGKYNRSSFACDSISEFQIQARKVALNGQVCLSVINEEINNPLQTSKVTCDKENRSQFWYWQLDSIIHSATGMCLTGSADTEKPSLTVSKCIKDDMSQSWKYWNQNYPYHVVSTGLKRYIDFGSIDAGSPAILNDQQILVAAEWIAVGGTEAAEKTLFALKGEGFCSQLAAGPGVSIAPTSCSEKDSEKGAKCTPSCASGYAASSTPAALTCLSTGLWSGIVPSCVAQSASTGVCKGIALGSGQQVTPASCLTGVNVGSGCEFSCSRGYVLSGAKIIYCKDADSWSDTAPKCTGYCLGLKTSRTVTMIPERCSSIFVLAGITCTQKCKDGYGTPDGQLSLTKCNGDGTWSSGDAMCSTACPDLSKEPYLAANGITTINNSTGLVATSLNCAQAAQIRGNTCAFSCPTGYVLDGPDKSTCGNDGEWIQPISKCVKQYTCPTISNTGVASAVYEPQRGSAIVPGTAVFLTCSSGYAVVGDDQRLCTAAGTWDGDGPDKPACEKMCPPLMPKFAATISPNTCTAEYAKAGTKCTLTCNGKATLSENVQALTTTCSDGAWDPPLQSCKTSENLDTPRQEFEMLTRLSTLGCLMVDSKNNVKWSIDSGCVSQAANTKWKWNRESKLYSTNGNKCLKPLDPKTDQTLLQVGACDDGSLTVRCGNPDSANQRFAIYAYNGEDRWLLNYAFDPLTALPTNVRLIKIPVDMKSIPMDYFDTVIVSANGNVQYSAGTDKTVCGYSCGGTITETTPQGYIYSPGYALSTMYHPYASCDWILLGYKKKITLELLDLDLEGASKPNIPCETDCLEVYRGSVDDSLRSELIVTFSGNDASAYHPHLTAIQSVTGNFLVRFRTNGVEEKKGFSMRYKYETIDPLEGCGTSPFNGNAEDATGVQMAAGKRIASSRWPWIVSIRQNERGRGKTFHRCTGVLAAADVVISAAHCARYFVNALERGDTFEIGVGYSSQSAIDEHAKSGSTVTVDRVFVHPQYDFNTRKFDIAVWKLTSSVDFTNDKQPICLPRFGYPVHSTYSVCYAVGWTKLNNGATSDGLWEYPLKIDSATWCDMELGLSSEQQFVCGAYAGLDGNAQAGTSSSEPLMCLFNGNWYLTGVAAYTHTGSRSIRRLYTDIHTNREWLSKALTRTTVVSYRSRGLQLVSSAPPGYENPDVGAANWFERF